MTTTTTPMSPAELLEKLRDLLQPYFDETAEVWSRGLRGLPSGENVAEWVTNDLAPNLEFPPEALSLLTTWAAAHGRAEREKALREAKQTARSHASYFVLPGEDKGEAHPEIRTQKMAVVTARKIAAAIAALQERPNDE